jgi:hypothetical protein
LVIALASVVACSQTTTPATAPAATQASQPNVDPAAKKILDALEAAGLRHKTIFCSDLTYVVLNPSLGDTETRTGYVKYQKDNPKDFTRFRIHFDTLQQSDGPRVTELKDYAFGPDKDGTQWMSIADFANKKLQQLQVARAGETVDPLKIGEGPFPIPFGQKTQDVLKCCDVTTRPPKAGDPPNTDYIRLIPKPDFRRKLNFATMDMWVDRNMALPVKIVSTADNKTATTVTFAKDQIQLNQKMDPADFKLIRPAGWTLESKPLGNQEE